MSIMVCVHSICFTYLTKARDHMASLPSYPSLQLLAFSFSSMLPFYYFIQNIFLFEVKSVVIKEIYSLSILYIYIYETTVISLV